MMLTLSSAACPDVRPDAAPPAAFVDFVVPPGFSAVRRARPHRFSRSAAWHLAAVLSLMSSCGAWAAYALLHMGL